MLLSIIIPAYNAEKTIHECVDSVLREAPIDSEIIIVDDGSKDSTPQICDEYAKNTENIKVIHKANGGLSSARNAGLDTATGEYIFFIDSDDYIEKKYFDLMFQQSADLVIGAFCAFYQNNLPDYSLNLENKYYNSLKDYLRDFHKYFPVTFNTAWGKLYRTVIIKEAKLRFREDLFMVEDILFNLNYYALCNTISYQSESVLMYRQTDGTLSRKTDDNLYAWYEKSYFELKELLENNGVFEDINKNKFYNSVYGNTLECLVGAARNSFSKTKDLCRDVCGSDLAVKAAEYNNSKKTMPISKAIKLRKKFLLLVALYAYVAALSIKSFWRKLK